ncbi:hypothetical protein CEF21_09015 [Bacillus sp. FJAT-42376]|uniref:hypothetical protein n=1 Tax=Bacillus sp. FJAT-42376 TaxID=2014076 RepID=UPI000F509234|nr:hypothetical protein [Bacillus sp. FJAT-42376]AZB42421.1 hypothetical protein CEF21_09015 [Bacillus sp. FJAT-42376]
MAKTEAFTDAIYDAIDEADGLKDGREWMLNRAGKLGIKNHVEEFGNEFEASFQEFEGWLTTLLTEKKPPASLEAINFALYETADTISLYVAGAEEWDEEGDWALAKDYAPLSVEPYFPVYKPIYQLLEDHLPAGLFLGTATIIIFVKEFVSRHGELFPDGVILGAGFDGGDVYDFMELN